MALTRAEWQRRKRLYHRGLGDFAVDQPLDLTQSIPDVSQYVDPGATSGDPWAALLGAIPQLGSEFAAMQNTAQTALPNSYQGTQAPETTAATPASTTAPAAPASGFTMSQLFQPPYLYYLMGGAGLLLILAASGGKSSGSGGGGNFIKL